MPIYEFTCADAHRFERSCAMQAPCPPCPACGAPTWRRPGRVSLSGRSAPGRPAAAMPQTWRSTYGADREYVASLRRELDRRTDVEDRHPELQGDRRVVLAHEGPYAAAPLYAGDPPRHGADAPRHGADPLRHDTGNATPAPSGSD